MYSLCLPGPLVPRLTQVQCPPRFSFGGSQSSSMQLRQLTWRVHLGALLAALTAALVHVMLYIHEREGGEAACLRQRRSTLPASACWSSCAVSPPSTHPHQATCGCSWWMGVRERACCPRPSGKVWQKVPQLVNYQSHQVQDEMCVTCWPRPGHVHTA
jgi:hypothetical protein